MVNWLGWPLGLDCLHTSQVVIDTVNAKGGLTIGGKNYTLQLISYDSNNDQATEVAAINRLVFQDKVNYIIGFPMYIGADLPITDPNKVILLGSTSDIATQMDPKWKYSACPAFINPMLTLTIGWFMGKYPQYKTYMANFMDDANGHNNFDIYARTMAAYNASANFTSVYVPASAVDMSAVGTMIAHNNPDVFIPTGGPGSENPVVKAAWDAGYRGKFFICHPTTYGTTVNVIPAAAMNGIISINGPTEFNPPLTQTAKDFKDAYIAKFGKWDVSDASVSGSAFCLVAALQKADSIDVDKVNSVIQSGLKFSDAAGDGMMISRGDFGNSRTVDSISAYYMVQYGSNEQDTKLVDTITVDQALALFRKAYPEK